MNDLMTRGVRNVIEMTNRYMGQLAQDVTTGIRSRILRTHQRDIFHCPYAKAINH
ncbi:hypothetical protein ACUN90_21600 [Escherichia sp. SP-MK2]